MKQQAHVKQSPISQHAESLHETRISIAGNMHAQCRLQASSCNPSLLFSRGDMKPGRYYCLL